MPMKILRSVSSAQRLTSRLRLNDKVIGFVPTMGFLHKGHLSLIKLARRRSDVLIVSIFVNPLQFGPNEDFKKYPRDFRSDEALCRNAGVDYLFYPAASDLYPSGYSTYVNVEGHSDILEGEHRPGHFRGVATIVMKLFNVVQPHFAVFGQKDAQQLFVIKKMVDDLNMGVKIITGNTAREKDGLAMSSRNVYLNKEQRKDAAVLYNALAYAKRKLVPGYNRDIPFLRKQMYKLIRSKPSVTKIDYIAFNDNRNLKPVETVKHSGKNSRILVSLAVRFGNTRLIDNIVIKY